jgi:hypothetical protein
MKKHCVKYPDDKFLAVRPCLVAICFGNRPAAKLLGTLLYRYNLRLENKEDAENQNAVKSANGEHPDQDTTYRIFRRQAQLVDDMCGEMTEKTLHDVAVPMLQLLSFLDLEEHMQSNCYTVDIDLVQQALDIYGQHGEGQLETFLIKHMQLEKFLITSDELEMFLIDKKHFLSGLEKVLIWNRNVSYCKRGRKGSPDVPSRRVLRRAQNLKEITKKNKKKESVAANADNTSPAHSFSEDDLDDETEPRIKRVETPTEPQKVIKPRHLTIPPTEKSPWLSHYKQTDPPSPAQDIPPVAAPEQAAFGQTEPLPLLLQEQADKEGEAIGHTTQRDYHHSGARTAHERGAAVSPAQSHARNTHRATPAQPEKVAQAASDVTQAKTVPKRRSRAKPVQEEKPSIPQEAVAIMDDWDTLFKRPYPRTDTHIQAAKLLMVCLPLSRQDLLDVKGFIFKTNPEWYRDKGVTLNDVVKYIGRWQSQQENAQPENEAPKPKYNDKGQLLGISGRPVVIANENWMYEIQGRA